MKIRLLTHFFTVIVLAGIMATSAFAQEPVRHLKLVYESEPTGANQTFYVRLVLVEHDTDVGAYQLLIGFDQSQGHLVGISNNLGINGSSSGADFSLNDNEAPLNGVAYADTSRQILLNTALPIYAPFDDNEDFNLGRLEFLTSPTYSPAQGQFGIYLSAVGSRLGFYNGVPDAIPVETISLDPGAGVADWAMY